MSLRRSVLVFTAAFLVGGAIGYWTFSHQSQAEPGPAAAAQEAGAGDHPGGKQLPDRASRPLRKRKVLPAIHLDEDGNYHLPAALVERLQFMALQEMKVNRGDLRILGLTEPELDQLEELVKRICGKCFNREVSVAKDFTRGEEELILLVAGDRVFAEAIKREAEEGVRSITGAKALLLEPRMVSDLENLTMDFGLFDYYQRIGRSKSSPGNLEIESIRISRPMKEGIAMPAPGDSFVDYQSRYYFGSQRRYGYGGSVPEFIRHLVTKEDCEALLPAGR